MNLHAPNIVADVQTDAAVFPTLLRVLKLTRAFQNLRLAEIGLQNGQDEFLLALSGGQRKCGCDLAEELGVRASTVSKMVDVLSARGLVERVSSEQDHRKVLVCLTMAGGKVCEAVGMAWADLDIELIQSATMLNTMALERDLQVLEAHVGRRLARLR